MVKGTIRRLKKFYKRRKPQVTAIVEAMKKPVSSGTKSNLVSEVQGTETAQSLDFQQ